MTKLVDVSHCKIKVSRVGSPDLCTAEPQCLLKSFPSASGMKAAAATVGMMGGVSGASALTDLQRY